MSASCLSPVVYWRLFLIYVFHGYLKSQTLKLGHGLKSISTSTSREASQTSFNSRFKCSSRHGMQSMGVKPRKEALLKNQNSPNHEAILAGRPGPDKAVARRFGPCVNMIVVYAAKVHKHMFHSPTLHPLPLNAGPLPPGREMWKEFGPDCLEEVHPHHNCRIPSGAQSKLHVVG
jgi:hypothetical protein